MSASPVMSQTPICVVSYCRLNRPSAGLFLLRSVKRHFRRHLWEDARVAFLEADAHLDGGAVAVGRWNDGEHLAGNVPVRIGVKDDGGGLPGADIGDLALVDVDLDL